MSIALEGLTKRYQGHPVVANLSLEVADRELLVLLGPSGSGKSTLLRMIAGLSEVDSGRILLHGRDVTHLSPQRRGVGFVFQSYALFRGMSVAENVEFPLAIRGVRRAERRRRRDELLELVGLAGLAGRMPAQLSGGQQQRVALARALAHRPEVLLLDEPFGALDARIRAELRRSIRAIQRELGITTVFVTHDQEEAFELADRVAVLHFGRLLEVGPPEELYLHPETEFVATFLGTANLMVGELSPSGVRLGPLELPLATRAAAAPEPRRVQVLFRPEDVAVKDSAEALDHPVLGQGVVEQVTFVGSTERLRLRVPPLPGARAIAPPAPFGGDHLVVEASRSQHQARRYPLLPGEPAWVGVRRVHALAHPGLALLLASDGSEEAQASLALAGWIGRLAHARVTVAVCGEDEQGLSARREDAKEQLGSGLGALELVPRPGSALEALSAEADERLPDLVIAGAEPAHAVAAAESLLASGEHHLLLASRSGPLPARLLIAVAVGEPGKEDVLFAGRLARHLSVPVTVLTVLAEADDSDLAVRFLAASVRTLTRMGLAASPLVRRGAPAEQILAEVEAGDPALVVLGAPLANQRGERRLSSVAARVLAEAGRPVLMVRSHEGAA
ncbi:MAG: ATP-binding cassette domain-containing protein [Thermoanaerobaculia bacterium]